MNHKCSLLYQWCKFTHLLFLLSIKSISVYVLRKKKKMQWFRTCVGCPHFLKITFINLFLLSSRLFCNMYYALWSCKKWASGPLREHYVGETMLLYFKERGAHFGWRMVNYTKNYKIRDLQLHYLNYHWS